MRRFHGGGFFVLCRLRFAGFGPSYRIVEAMLVLRFKERACASLSALILASLSLLRLQRLCLSWKAMRLSGPSQCDIGGERTDITLDQQQAINVNSNTPYNS